MEKFRTVGKVKDAHGLKGELYITLFAKEAAWLKKLKEVRLKANEESEAQVYTLKHGRVHKGALLALCHEIKDRTQAESFRGFLFEIPESFLVSEKGETLYLSEIDGFAVEVAGQGAVGRIVGFSSNGAQDLLVIETSAGEFEVPFVEAFVEKIDYEAKRIHLNLPEGLLGEPVDEETPSGSDAAGDDAD